MKGLMQKLWKDDAGIVALEYLFVATIVGLGLAVGLSALAFSLNAELGELGEAIAALSQGYSIATVSSSSTGSTSTSSTWVITGTKDSSATDVPGNNSQSLSAASNNATIAVP
jgi:Flp pilus assembly pilin Flp